MLKLNEIVKITAIIDNDPELTDNKEEDIIYMELPLFSLGQNPSKWLRFTFINSSSKDDSIGNRITSHFPNYLMQKSF